MNAELSRTAEQLSCGSCLPVDPQTNSDTVLPSNQFDINVVIDDFSREVYGLLGIPIDATNMGLVVKKIKSAASKAIPFLISTPNLDFLRVANTDVGFRESLLASDLCPVDGIPLVWLARLLGIPILERTAGSDIFDALKSADGSDQPLKIYLFGGEDGVAAAAGKTLNENRGGMICVGSLSPGFGPLEELSTDRIIDAINASHADFLIASLSATKGQAWLMRNRQRLTIPVRAHLGAALNFEAGTLKRAPEAWRKWCFEWLWRIKEEPYLWRRYWKDFRFLAHLLMTSVVPLVWLLRLRKRDPVSLEMKHSQDKQAFHLHLVGHAAAPHIARAIDTFRQAIHSGLDVVIHLSDCYHIDTRFFGVLLMLRKQLKERGRSLTLINLSSPLERIFRLNGFEYLLASNSRGHDAN